MKQVSDEPSVSPITQATVRIAALWVGLFLVIERLASFLSTTFLARWFTREEMGIVAVLSMLHLGIQVFTEMGHHAALIHRSDDRLDDAIDTSFFAALARGVLLTAVMVLSSGLVAEFFREPRLGPFIAASSIVFFLAGAENVSIVRFQRRVEMRVPKILGATATLTSLVVTISTAIAFNTIWCVVYGSIAGRAMRTIMSHVLAPSRPRLYFSKEIFWELFRYGRNIWGVAVLVFLVTQLDDAIVGRVLSLDALALYVMAYTMANVPISSITSIASEVAFPTWSEVVRQGDTETRDRMFVETVRFTGAVSIAVTVALFVGGADVLETVFGAKWRDADAALGVLVWFGLIRGISANFGTLFNSLGMPNLILREIAIKAVIIAITIYPMTKAWGIQGAALSVTLPMVIITPFAAYIYLRIAKIDFWRLPRALGIPAVAGALVMGLEQLVQAEAWYVAAIAPVRAVGWIILTAVVVLGGTWVADARFRDVIKRFLEREEKA